MKIRLHKTYLGIFYLWLTITLLLLTTVSFSQSVKYVSSEVYINQPDSLRLGTLNFSDCSRTDIFAFGFEINAPYTDITLDSDSNYYYYRSLTVDGAGFENKLFLFEFHPDYIYTGLVVGQFNEPKEGMTCDKQGRIYLAGEGLSVWNGGQIIDLGALPSLMHCRGDLTFRQGKLYLSSINNTLVEVDLDNPMNSSVVMTFPPGTPEVHGLATVNLECDSVETYAVASIPFGGGSTIYRIDFDTWTLEEICQYDFYITGLASYDECIFPDCTILVDLDADDSSGAIGSKDFRYEQACTFPLPITDTDVSLHSDLEMIDSIEIRLINPFNANEFLSLASGFNLDIVQANPHKLILINNGNTELNDFATALAAVLYHNDHPTFVYGERVIEVKAHFGFYQSTIARSYIPINEVTINPSLMIDSVSCYGLSDGSISSTPSGGTAPYGFIWSNGEHEASIDNISAGLYNLTITDAFACSSDFEISLDQADSLVLTIINPSVDTICNLAGILAAEPMGGTGAYEYSWSNGFDGIENDQLAPGNYSLTLTDANGCTAIANYTLVEGTDLINTISETPCYNTTYVVNGQDYTTDTSFCLAYTLANGCDSLECYTLDFYEENSNTILEHICTGDSVLIEGIYYSSDTIIDFVYTDINGCDSILVYDLTLFETPIINFETTGTLCEDEEVLIEVNGFQTYTWSTNATGDFLIIDQAGTYQVTVTDDNNCTATDAIVIYDPEISIYTSSFDPSCYESEDGLIVIDSLVGGQAPYSTRLNNGPSSSNMIFDNLTAGEYFIEIQDAQGCIAEINLELFQADQIEIQIQDQFTTFPGGSIDLSIETNAATAQVSWSPIDFLPCPTCFENTISPTYSIAYEVTIIDADGCIVQKTISINLSETIDIYVPNIFSPNDDGHNDILTVYAAPNAVRNIINLTIMSRNGHAVYQAQNFLPNDNSLAWDGTFLGKEAQTGVYILYITYENSLGQIKQEIHDLTLVR